MRDWSVALSSYLILQVPHPVLDLGFPVLRCFNPNEDLKLIPLSDILLSPLIDGLESAQSRLQRGYGCAPLYEDGETFQRLLVHHHRRLDLANYNPYNGPNE